MMEKCLWWNDECPENKSHDSVLYIRSNWFIVIKIFFAPYVNVFDKIQQKENFMQCAIHGGHMGSMFESRHITFTVLVRHKKPTKMSEIILLYNITNIRVIRQFNEINCTTGDNYNNYCTQDTASIIH